MEYKKDNINSNSINKGQGNFAMPNMGEQGSHRVSKSFSFVFRKSEKLTTALYMVTDIMSDREPMKWKMRESAVELMAGVTQSMGGTPSERMHALADVLKKIERLISFLDISRSSRILSDMNATVLKKEYAVLKSSVEYEWTKVFDHDRTMLTENFFHVSDDRVNEVRTESIVEKNIRHNGVDNNKRHDKEVHAKKNQLIGSNVPEMSGGILTSSETVATQIRHAPIVIHPERMHGTSQHRDINPFSQSEKSDDLLPERNRVDSGKGDRRTIILALIKQKPSLGVKDFVKSIPNVSEKTIQRELLALVADGVLVKRGERRWSTYSLPGQ